MTTFQFIVVICAGIVTILGAISIITGAIVKKNSSDIKGACAEKFNAMRSDIKDVESGARERSNRILVMETRFTEIISRLSKLETIVDKNAEQTAWIYAYMKQQNNDDNEA